MVYHLQDLKNSQVLHPYDYGPHLNMFCSVSVHV
ncbi:unnamed protein product [Schistosoma curassoni]|uniref:Uncharacterized protein n=1 Tax=Schistosoma curassoni TaxID=6186 RepID=A0A183KIS0_9TREM|nr:unnamed protein product [Schistosoma curassoni]